MRNLKTLFTSFNKNTLLALPIGLRLKLSISISVSVIIILLGLTLYIYQKSIIFNDAKNHCYLSIDDLIRFTENEIEASAYHVEKYGQSVAHFLTSYENMRIDESKSFLYKANIPGTSRDTVLKVPAVYSGKTVLQGDSTIVPKLHKMGVSFFIYFQKVDNYYVEIVHSEYPDKMKKFESWLSPLNSGNWKFDSPHEFKKSFWNGKKWLQAYRLYVLENGEIKASYDNAKEKIIGALVVGINERNEAKLKKTFTDKVFYKTGLCYQITDRGKVNYHKNIEDSKNISDLEYCKQIIAEKHSEPTYISVKDTSGVRKFYFYKYFSKTYNNVVIEIPEKEIFASLYALRNGIIIAVIVIILSIILIVSGVAKSITSRLSNAIDLAKKISNGVLTDSIFIDSKDELAELGGALNQMNGILNNTVGNINDTVKTIDSASGILKDTSAVISNGAITQASSLEEVSASMEEMTGTIEHTTYSAQDAEKISKESAINIDESSKVLHESVSFLSDIKDKVSIIRDIARQTNILALNAAVVAANAGEYGRGFTVVAREVQKLAERSNDAALDITTVSQKGIEIAQIAAKQLSDHVPLVQKTAAQIKEIAEANNEQKIGIDQINYAVQGLNSITQQNAEQATKISQSIELFTENTQSLSNMVQFFKIKES